MDLDPDDPRLPSRPLIGMAILALPGIAFLLLVVGYAILFAAGLTGRAAAGPEIELRFEGCAEARVVLSKRLADMGLAATELPGETIGFRLSLPSDPAVAASVPATLASPGRLEVEGQGKILADNSDLRDASVRMDLFVEPSLLLALDEDAAERVKQHAGRGQRISLKIDGRTVASAPLERAVAELEFSSIAASRDRWVEIAAWSVTVDHPLPCPVRALP